LLPLRLITESHWIPACAGMTFAGLVDYQPSSRRRPGPSVFA